MARFSIVAIAALALVACQPQSTKPPPGSPFLQITASPKQIDDQGGKTQLNILAFDASGNAGTGTVALTTPAGSLGGAGKTASITLDSRGAGTILFTCAVSSDPNCFGQVKITGTWNSQTGSVTVGILTTSVDAGTDAGNGDAGTDGGTGFGNGTVLTVSANKQEIILGAGDFATITAHLSVPDSGTPIANQSIAFSTTLGTVNPTSATTDSAGNAQTQLSDTGDGGIATVTATDVASDATASVNVTVASVRQITWVSTQCGGVDCTIMGPTGNGFNEQAQVTFKVIDVANQPVVSATVNFSLINGPSGTTVQPSGVTDANGLVVANVSSGPQLGVFNVKAVVIPGVVETLSPAIGVVAVKPTNETFTFQCGQVNVPAYIATQPPAQIQISCNVGLTDRLNNAIGKPTSVFFKAEAGNLPNYVNTVKFDPTNPTGTAVGTASVTFQTAPGGTFPAEDVPPLPALTSAQQPYPAPRGAEPSIVVNGVTHNPRDGLVTLLAYTSGEEYYADTNGNGQYDQGEPFVDQAEPFLDMNDNGTWDANEFYIDTNNNGKWDGPNGVWDGNTNVWTETYLLYTDRPVPNPTYTYLVPSPFSGDCATNTGIPKGGQVGLSIHAGDPNLNRPWGSTTFTASHQASKGTLSFTGTMLDGYGFGVQRSLVDSQTGNECFLGTTPVCVWQTFFTWWGAGDLQSGIVVNGAPLNDTNPCAPDSISVSITTSNVTILAPLDQGAIE